MEKTIHGSGSGVKEYPCEGSENVYSKEFVLYNDSIT